MHLIGMVVSQSGEHLSIPRLLLLLRTRTTMRLPVTSLAEDLVPVFGDM